MKARIIIISGECGVGKSTICHKTVTLAQNRGYICGGIITLHRPGDVLEVLDVRSSFARQLTLEPGVSPAVIQGRFRLDPRALLWGDDVLARATPCDLLVVDELGPLELEQGWGWQQALTVLHKADFALAFVVVRPELVVQAQLKLPESAMAVLIVTVENRDELPATLLEMLEREGKSI